MTRRRRLLFRSTLFGIAVAGVAVVGWAVATHHPSSVSFFPKCSLYTATGLHCIGCGLTRSLHAWLNGDWRQAIAYHPLSFLLLPYAGWHLLKLLWGIAWGSDHPCEKWRMPRVLVWTATVILLGFAVLRNLPWHPFTILAPHELVQGEPSPASGGQ